MMKIFKRNSIKLLGTFFILILLYLFLVFKYSIDEYKLLIYLGMLLLCSWIILFVNKYRLINVPVIFLVAYLIVLGMAPIAYYVVGLSYHEYQLPIICLSFVLFYAGYYFLDILVIKKRKRLSKSTLLTQYNSKNIVKISTIIYFIGLLANLLYLIKNRYLLFSSNINDGRITALSGNGVLIYLGKLMWLGVFICMEEYLKNEKQQKKLFLMIGVAIILSVLSGFRSAAVDAILVLIIMWNKKKPINQVFLIVSVVALFIGVLAYGIIRDASNTTILASLYSELRVGSANLNYIFEAFPEKIDFQYGYTYLLNFIMILPGDNLDFTLWLKDVLNLQFSGGGLTPTIVGEFYINWGSIGIYIGMYCFGMAMRLVQEYYENGNSILVPALFIGYIRSFVRGGLANCSILFIIYIVGYYGIKWFASNFYIKFKN